MPFMADSTYANLKTTFLEAYALSNPAGDPDPEWDLQGHATPRLGNHTWRRYADKKARDSSFRHHLSSDEQNLFFGWELKELLSNMQIKYAGQQRSVRVKRAQLTAYA